MSGSALISSIPNILKTVPVHEGGVKGVNGTGVDSDSDSRNAGFAVDEYASFRVRLRRQDDASLFKSVKTVGVYEHDPDLSFWFGRQALR